MCVSCFVYLPLSHFEMWRSQERESHGVFNGAVVTRSPLYSSAVEIRHPGGSCSPGLKSGSKPALYTKVAGLGFLVIDE